MSEEAKARMGVTGPQSGPESIHLSWWNRIRIRTLFFGVIAAILPVLLVSGYYLYFAKLDLQRSVQVENNLLAERLAQEVDMSLDRTEESLKNLALNLTDVNETFRTESLKNNSQVQLQFYSFLREFSLVDEVVVLNAQGEAIAGVNRFQIFQTETNWVSSQFLKGLSANKPSYSDVQFLSSGIPTVKIVIPFASEPGFSGGLGIRLRLRGLLTTLKIPNPLASTDLFVVDPSGRLIADSDVTRVLEKADVRQSYTVQNFLQYKDPQKLPALNQYVSYTGQKVIGGYEVLPRNGWGVMVEQPAAVAFASINQLIMRFLIFILLILLLSVSASIVFGLSITRPVERLKEAAWTISRGCLEERVKEERNDELGQLARTFNFMMERLQTQFNEQRRMEDLMVQADKLSALGLLASGFAHEINNPLAIIQGYAEDLEEQLAESAGRHETPEPERVKRSLRTIRKHIGRAQKITQSLLNFSRKSEWTLEEIQVEQVIEESLALLEILLKKKRVQVGKCWDSPLPRVRGDALQLVQVFVNLISNALDALSEQGELRIEAHSCVERDESKLEITVHDNGEGIEAELLAKIFDPFFTTKEVGKGTGLGLAISYGIIARMGGTIEVASEPGRGTEVRITLPVLVKQGKRQGGEENGRGSEG